METHCSICGKLIGETQTRDTSNDICLVCFAKELNKLDKILQEAENYEKKREETEAKKQTN